MMGSFLNNIVRSPTKPSVDVENLVTTYRDLMKIPLLKDAELRKGATSVVSCWTEDILEAERALTLCYAQELDQNLNVVSESDFGVDISNQIAQVVSPREDLMAVLRDLSDSGDKPMQVLEIWKGGQLKRCINLSALGVHKDIYSDSDFGSFTWDPSGKCFMYVAERKPPTSEPFYAPGEGNKENAEPLTKGHEYDYDPDWGEAMVNKRFSAVAICDVEAETCKIVQGIPQHLCPGQVQWSPDGSSIVGLAWTTEPRRLGLRLSTNRPSVIFNITLDGNYREISKPGMAVRSPRFTDDGKFLIWMQREAKGSHHMSHQIVKTAWPLTEEPIIEVILEQVEAEIIIEGGEKFTGMYAHGLPKRPFASDNRRILFSTQQRTETHSYIMDMESKKLTKISDTTMPCSTTILDVKNDIVLASRSSFAQPPQLLIARLPAAGEERNMKWNILKDNKVDVPEVLAKGRVKTMDLIHENDDDEIKNFTALFFTGAESDNESAASRPMIVYPHGGPHMSFINEFTTEAAFFITSGFSLLQVNYRGSIGAGDKSVVCLVGKLGDLDVKDCVLATEQACERFSVDKSKCLTLGYSHGGFLVGHLIGQHPDLFRAAVMGNGVTNVPAMENSSDCPEGMTVHMGRNYTNVGPIDESFALTLLRSSPMVHAHNAKTPTLLLLGSVDKRVPYFQGIEFYHKLRANGCKARALVYEDNHDLTATTQIGTDCDINIILWFYEHLN